MFNILFVDKLKKFVLIKTILDLSITPLHNCHLKLNDYFFYINEHVELHFTCKTIADTPKNCFLFLILITVVLVIKRTNIIIVMQFFLWKFTSINYFSCNSKLHECFEHFLCNYGVTYTTSFTSHCISDAVI